MSELTSFPPNPKVLLNANNVDGVHNAQAVHGGSVTSWKNLGAAGVADFATQGVDRQAPTFRTSRFLTSVVFDGIRSGLSSLGSKNTLGFIHNTGVFDLFLSIRRRDILQGGNRRLFGSQLLANDTTRGMQILMNPADDLVGDIKVIFGNGTTNILTFTSTVKTPANTFVSLLIRGDGTKIQLSTDFFTFQSAAFTGAFGTSAPADQDYSVGSMVLNESKYPGDVNVLAIYDRNLSPAELVQLKGAVNRQTANVPPPAHVVCIGDSTTLGLSDLDYHPWPVLLEIAPQLIDAVLVSNYGHSGGTAANMLTDYTNQVALLDPAPDFIVLDGFVNDLIAGSTASSIFATAKTLIDTALAAGIQLLLVETAPWGAYSAWTSGKQAQFDALRALMIAYVPPGLIANVNLYPIMGRTDDPQRMRATYNFGDGLHFKQEGDNFVAAHIAPALAPFVPPTAALSTAAILRVEPKGGAIGQLDPINIDVASTTGLIVRIETSAGFETVYANGAFSALYSAGSTVTALTVGQRLAVRRADGWPPGQLILDL